MPFIPLKPSSDAAQEFPRVTPDQQVARDREAARLVSTELENSDDPEQQAILAKEYRLRFGAEPRPSATTSERRGFIPLDSALEEPATQRGFVRLEAGESPSQRGFIPLEGESKPGMVDRAATAINSVFRQPSVMDGYQAPTPSNGAQGFSPMRQDAYNKLRASFLQASPADLEKAAGGEGVTANVALQVMKERGLYRDKVEAGTAGRLDDLSMGGNIKNPDTRGAEIAGMAAQLKNGPRQPAPEGSGVFSNAVMRGIKNNSAMMSGLAAAGAKALGAEDLALTLLKENFRAQQEAGQYPAQIQDFTHIQSIGDVPTYILEGLVENAPQLIGSIGSGVVGGMLARTAGAKAVAGMTAEVAAKELARRTALGAVAGVGAASVGMETGSIYGDIAKETGQERPGLALGYGTAAGALDALPALRAVRKIMGDEPVSWAVGQVAKRYGKEALVQLGGEGATEFLQTWIEKAAVSHVDGRPLATKENLVEALDAGIKGGISGAGIGVGSQLVGDARNLSRPATPETLATPGETQRGFVPLGSEAATDPAAAPSLAGSGQEAANAIREVSDYTQAENIAQNGPERMSPVVGDEYALPPPEAQGFNPLQNEGAHGLPGMADELQPVPVEGWTGADLDLPSMQPAAALEVPQATVQALTPERSGRLEMIERRLAAVSTPHPNPVIQASLDRRAAKLMAERAQLVQAEADRTMTRLQDESASMQYPAPERPATLNMADTRNAFAPGEQYAGFIQDTPADAGTTAPESTAGRGKPIRREDILVPFAKALGTSIYEGRVKGKGRLGFFRPGVQETRIKRHADLETAAHEIAHLIDDRVPAIRQTWESNPALEAELRSISYDSSKVYEGFAEGVRLWMTQPETLLEKAPRTHAWLEQFAGSHAYGPAMRKAQTGMTQWFGQDAIDRARSKIGDHRPLSEALDGIWDRFRQSVSDDLHGVYRMERDLTGTIAPAGAYESARLSRASASIADGAVRYGYPVKKADGSFTYAGRGLEEILEPVAGNLEDALLYFVGRSARELFAQGRERLFTQGEIDAMLRLRTPEREAAFKDYQIWNKGILDFAEAQGVINPESRKLWKRVEYLPFHRVAQPDGGMKGKPGDWAGIKALTGGTENIRDVLGNMVSNAAMLIDKAVKNEARVKIAHLAEKQGAAKFMARINPETRPVKVAGDQVLSEMLKRYGLTVDGEAPVFFEFLLHGQPPVGGNVVAVMKAGKPSFYEVADPILFRSLQAIDRPPTQWLTKWLGMPKRLGQATITMTPDFISANLARDTLMAAVMSRAGFRPVIDSLQGMRLRVTHDKAYVDYVANGGGLSSIYLDEGKLRGKLEKFYSRQGIDPRAVLDTPGKILSFIENLGDALESSSRVGEYQRAIQAGEHPRHAAYLAREAAVDFAMRGDSKALGFLYDTVIFLRPAVVSMDRLYRGIAHDPNKMAIAAKTSMLALISVGLYMLNRDKPEYQDMDDWKKDGYWHFFVPGPDGQEKHFMWPKAFEVGAVASLAERTTEKLLQDNPEGLGKDFARIVGHTFNLNFMPQFMAPLYEQATNRSNFTKAPLETPGMENLQPFLRAKPNTSETMKALGMATRDLPESLQVNPVRAEALLRGYLNTWGMYGLMLSDRAFFGDKLPETRLDQMPVVRRFYSQEPAQHTRFETQFYEMLGEAKRLQGTLRELDKQGRPDIADEKEQSPMAGEAKPLERAQKNLADLNAEMREIRRNDALSPAEKRQQLDAVTVKRNALLKGAVLDAKAAQKAKPQP